MRGQQNRAVQSAETKKGRLEPGCRERAIEFSSANALWPPEKSVLNPVLVSSPWYVANDLERRHDGNAVTARDESLVEGITDALSPWSAQQRCVSGSRPSRQA